MEFLTEYGLFLAKAVTVVVALGLLISLVAGLGSRSKSSVEKGYLEVTKLNQRFDDLSQALRLATLDEAEQKTEEKRLAKEEKQKQKAKKKAAADESEDKAVRQRVFVLDFHGDIRASAVTHFREEITAVLAQSREGDEVVVRLESPGGMVHSYGLASSQLDRIRKKGVTLTVCVDKVAASGGYMMACVAERILAAPFAILGSIGVVAQLPNFHRLLKKHDVDFEVHTAGQYKRTLTVFGENTAEGREKFVQDLEDTHVLFKSFVAEHRASVDIDNIATGEIWLGSRALEMGLVDELATSDEYLMNRAAEADLFEVHYVIKKKLYEKLGFAAEESADRLLLRWWQRFTNQSRHIG